MKSDELDDARRIALPYRVDNGSDFRLAAHDTSTTGEFDPGDRDAARKLLKKSVKWLASEQEMLHAQDRWGVLLVFQAMDAAGKDGTIKHVMSGINPTGCQVTSFKKPSAEELDHDYLWRCHSALPGRGEIGIFNRSYYEEVLVVRVHPEILGYQRLPESLVSGKVWDERLEDIAAFERYLSRNGIVVLKFFLNVSRDEQHQRFRDRLDEPDKHWKFSAGDVRESALWDHYMHAYEEAIRHTACAHAPWYVVPADNKWYMRLVVASAIVSAIEDLDLAYPEVTGKQREEIEQARIDLEPD
jgi:PPK2 family polyphosphate:nucleotide phosphotransferase